MPATTKLAVVKRSRRKGESIAKIALDIGVDRADIVYVGRPSKWGNPFSGPKDKAAAAFLGWLAGVEYKDFEQERRATILRDTDELVGKVLACWCCDWTGEGRIPDCHAAVLWMVANNEYRRREAAA